MKSGIPRAFVEAQLNSDPSLKALAPEAFATEINNRYRRQQQILKEQYASSTEPVTFKAQNNLRLSDGTVTLVASKRVVANAAQIDASIAAQKERTAKWIGKAVELRASRAESPAVKPEPIPAAPATK